jgi:hypothetical protein
MLKKEVCLLAITKLRTQKGIETSDENMIATVHGTPLQDTPRLAAGRNACLAEGVIRGTGKSPLST